VRCSAVTRDMEYYLSLINIFPLAVGAFRYEEQRDWIKVGRRRIKKSPDMIFEIWICPQAQHGVSPFVLAKDVRESAMENCSSVVKKNECFATVGSLEIEK
jgi:hypothetical protein